MNQKLTALIIEDGKSDYIFLKKHLEILEEWDIEVLSAETFSEAKKMMTSAEIDICFLDYFIDDEVADDFLEEVQPYREYIPFVLISGQEVEKLKNIAFTIKVDDFIGKHDISKALLTRVIRYCVSNNRAILKAKVQEQKYLNLFNNSLEAIFTADENFKILRANQSFKELIKVDLNADFDFRSLFKNDEYDQFFSPLFDGQERNIKRTKLINSNGEELEVYLAISRILNENERAAYQVVIHDITDFEQIQRSLHETEKSNLIQRMARIIGHEVRNPLTNILLAAEEMKDDMQENEDALMMLSMIHRNSQRISSLIDNFLKNTRNSEIVKKEHVLESVIKEAFINCEDRVKLKEIEYTLLGLDGKTMVQIDEEKIKIVLTNIIINATEALDNTNSPALSVQLLITEGTPKVIIEDNGVGMSDEVKLHLFSPFYSSKQGGLGLGMANSKNIIDEHNAKIIVDSQLGKGTRFEIHFS